MASTSIISPKKLHEKNSLIVPMSKMPNTKRISGSYFKDCSSRHVSSENGIQCRFSYATWCPICESEERCKTIGQVRRRRCKSEGMYIEKSKEYYNKASSIRGFGLQPYLDDFEPYQNYWTDLKRTDSCDYYLSPHKVHNSRSPELNSNASGSEKMMKPLWKPCENHIEPNRGYYKTWNNIDNAMEKDRIYYTKQKDDTLRPLHERYFNEVESLRSKLHELKGSGKLIDTKQTIQKSEMFARNGNQSSVEIRLKRPRENSPSLYRPKTSPSSARKDIPSPSSQSHSYNDLPYSGESSMLNNDPAISSDSDYIDSGCEEEDDVKDGSELDFEEDDISFATSSKISPLTVRPPSNLLRSVPTDVAGNKSGSVDQGNLHPGLRASLFPHVPPYLKFSMHDEKGAVLPSTVQKLLKWKLSTITPLVVRKTVVNSNFKLVRKSNDWCGTWGKHMKSLCFKTIREYQKINHFPGTFQIGRKDRLWKNLYRLMTKFGKKEFGFIPRTYVLPQDTKMLRSAWEKNCGKEKWIVKPPASARGTGIKVIHKWTQIPKKCPLVVQKYISDPYLINGSKFDLRLYVLVTSINPMRVYIYDNGLVRFASVKYSNEMTSLADRYMHLTNYSINKLSSQYTQNEDASACQGHKWSLQAMWTYLEKERGVNVKELWNHLIDLVIKTIISGESAISQLSSANLASRYCSFELFGVDVLLDEWLKPWLLEVNISPSLHSSSPLDLAVKGPLVRDLLNIAGYQIPNKLSSQVQAELAESLGVQYDLCFDRRLYTSALSNEERLKHVAFHQNEAREDYIDAILHDLTPDDVRHLIQYEDELTQIGNFQKIFPTSHSYNYHQFFEAPRYYNMLFDAWEIKQSKDRTKGIKLLESLCRKEIHLDTTHIPPKRTKVCMSQSENDLKNPNQDLLEENPEVFKEDMNIAVHSKPREKWSLTLACGTICRAARPRSGKPGVVTKPYPRSSYVACRPVKSAESFS